MRFASSTCACLLIAGLTTTAAGSNGVSHVPRALLRTGIAYPAAPAAIVRMRVRSDASCAGGAHGGYAFDSSTAFMTNFSTAEVFGESNVASGTDSAALDGSGNSVCEAYSTIAGGASNSIDGGNAAEESFIGAGYGNTVAYERSSISSGTVNEVTGEDTFIGAGQSNMGGARESFIGAGDTNVINAAATASSILGGSRNSVSGEYASVLGGFGNAAKGTYAIVAGGDADLAAGVLTFAAGYHAHATHNGSFVWSDYTANSGTVADSASNQFVVRASGGTYVYSNEALTAGVKLAAGSGTWASLSDRNAKTDLAPLDGASILAKVDALPIGTWRYKGERGVRHAGPMAQDFYSAFGIGEDDRHITSIDEDGVALAAIKALDTKLVQKNVRVESELARVEVKLARKDAQVDALLAAVGRLNATTALLEREARRQK